MASTGIRYGIKYGLIASVIIIAFWWLWGLFYYRWSDTRLKQLMTAKYKITSISDNYIEMEQIQLAPDKSYVTGMAVIKDDSYKTINSIPVRYDISNNCSFSGMCISP